MRILYIGPDYRGSNGTSFRDAFIELGHEVRTIDDERFDPVLTNPVASLVRKLRRRPPESLVSSLNRAVLEEARRFRPDLVFFVKAYHVMPDTLASLRPIAPRFVYMNDDMFNPANQTPTFREAVPQFDCILTTKSYNVREFLAAGAVSALYIPNAYDPAVHYPVQPSAADMALLEGDLAFIGTFRAPRADYLSRLAEYNCEFRINIWGGGWTKMNRCDHWHKLWRWRRLRTCLRFHDLRCEAMSKAMQANRVCLGLLNHENRDLHTSRTFEVPACAGFMLAERTEEHRLYFEEDKEAVYFSTFEELIDKLRFYVAHSEPRLRIARAGYLRCTGSPYTYLDRARFVTQVVCRHSPAARNGLAARAGAGLRILRGKE